MEDVLHSILMEFEIDQPYNQYSIKQFGTGLIHKTYLVSLNDSPEYILQNINHHVFHRPDDIVFNINLLEDFLNKFYPEYPFAHLIKTKTNKGLLVKGEDHYRLSSFIKGTHSLDYCSHPEQAYQASYAFGTFTNQLNNIQIEKFRYPIPGFHDLIKRFHAFELSIIQGNQIRIEENKSIIQWMFDRKDIVLKYQTILNDHSFKKRIIHHDTKISNVLFDDNDKCVTVIDLDTTMPGYCLSDIGDMIRTYTSPANEEEMDAEKVFVRKEFLEAIIDGYSEKMADQLSEIEKENLFFGGRFMIYMQALRFFTDYLNDDIYYGSRYVKHNLVRTKNQIKLLESLDSII